jgi:hypothetical protein
LTRQLQQRWGPGAIAPSSTLAANAASLQLKQACSEHLWHGHRLFIAGQLSAAAVAYRCDGAQHFMTSDICSAVVLYLWVVQFHACFHHSLGNAHFPFVFPVHPSVVTHAAAMRES